MKRFECPHCGMDKPSHNGTGSDVSCCGEIGHAVETQEHHRIPLDAFPKTERTFLKWCADGRFPLVFREV